MPLFTKRPVTIQAMRLPEAYPEGVDPSSDGYARNLEAAKVLDWLRAELGEGFDPALLDDPLPENRPDDGWAIDPADGAVLIATLEGVMKASPGDWIIQGVAGEFYPCKPDIFAESYAPAVDGELELPFVDVVLEGDGGADGYQFVEVEDGHGNSADVGQWLTRDDGLTVLRIPLGDAR